MNLYDRRRVVARLRLHGGRAARLCGCSTATMRGSAAHRHCGAAGVDVESGARQRADRHRPTTRRRRSSSTVRRRRRPGRRRHHHPAGPTATEANDGQRPASAATWTPRSRPCTTLLAPDGRDAHGRSTLDNGQTTTCINTLGTPLPAGVDIVLHTDMFTLIGDLADAPVPVRISW